MTTCADAATLMITAPPISQSLSFLAQASGVSVAGGQKKKDDRPGTAGAAQGEGRSPASPASLLIRRPWEGWVSASCVVRRTIEMKALICFPSLGAGRAQILSALCAASISAGHRSDITR